MGYSGWIVVEAEQDPAKAPPHAYSKKGFEHIQEVCRAADLSIQS
jgi:inosose dehydratase